MSTVPGYKYITQENIDEGVFNVSSAEEFSEAQKYNAKMFTNRKIKYRFLSEFWGMVCTDVILVPLLIIMNNEKANISSDLLMSMSVLPNYFWLYMLLIAVYVFLFVLFVAKKKDYDWRKCLAYTSLLVPINLAYIALVAINCILMYFFNKLDKELKAEPGYPSFICLKLTFIKDEPDDTPSEDAKASSYKPGEMDDLDFL